VGMLVTLSFVGTWAFVSRRRTAVPTSADEPLAAQTLIYFSCSSCRKRFQVKSEWAGKKGKCVQCGHAMIVPMCPGDRSVATAGAKPARSSRNLVFAAVAFLAVIGLGGVTYALTDGPASGWLSARVLIAAAVGMTALTALLPFERRVPAPMLQLSLFRSRQFDAINATTVLFYGALTAAGYLLILQCELRLGYTAAQAGAALIPESAVFLAIAPVSGALVSRIGTRQLMVVGILTVAAAFIWLSRARPGDGYTTAILPGTLLWGVGDGLAATPLTAAVLASVNDADLGIASAINSAAAWVGGVVVIAIVPALIGASGGQHLAHALAYGYQPAMIAMAGLSVVCALITGVQVPDDRVASPQLAPHPRPHGCAFPA
jgi:hypothetical protein